MITENIEEVKIGQHEWGKVWSRMNRQGYSVSQLEMIIAECKIENQLIAASLIWASLVPSEEIFKQAAELVAANDLEELWGAFYSIKTRKGFVAAVLAIVHYELLNGLEDGEYYPWIEVFAKGKEYWSRHSGRKRN
ncbi:MAG: hypothetical protein RMY36_030855 [Nostoc sp. SerVER01]